MPLSAESSGQGIEPYADRGPSRTSPAEGEWCDQNLQLSLSIISTVFS
jgi:hypothetical protein